MLLLALGISGQQCLARQTQAKTDTIRTISLKAATISIKQKETPGTVVKMDGEQLRLNQPRTIGDALSQLPGVQSSNFGPNSSLPVIRSLSGNRVKMLSNNMPVNDLSGISPNINVNVDMNTIQSVTVYKGSASVLYGGRAIGGAVQMKDNTIPLVAFKKKIEGNASVQGATNNGSSQAIQLGGNAGQRWIWNIGGMHHQNKDLKIPGNTKAPIAFDPKMDDLTQSMAQVFVDKEIVRNLTLYPYLSQFVLDNINDPSWGLSEGDLYTDKPTSFVDGETVQNPANPLYIPGQDPNTPRSTTIYKGIRDYAPVEYGVMPNSHAKLTMFNAGTSYRGKNFYVGAGFKGSSGYYGIPAFALYKLPGHTHGPVTQNMTYLPINTRSISNTTLLETAYTPESGPLSSYKLNYQWQAGDDRELLGIYQANKFTSNRHSIRLEAEQRTWTIIKGTSGVDFNFAKIQGKGESRYIPDNLSRELGIFTLQQLEYSLVKLDLGYRHDLVERIAMPDASYKTSRGMAGGKLSSRNFHLNQFSANTLVSIIEGVAATAAFNHSERAPDVDELYAGNNHFAIMIEENGDDRLPKETATGYELGVALKFKGLTLKANRYHTAYENYLYLAHTGISRSGGFLVKEWRASDTEIDGWEAQSSYEMKIAKEQSLQLGAYFDLVKNRNTSDSEMRNWAEGDFMPNMPTSRFGFSMAWAIKNAGLNINFDRSLKQRFLGKNINPEPPMPAYSMLSAGLNYRPKLQVVKGEIFVNGNNLLNVEARPQNSFLKYVAPLPGRNITIGIRTAI